MKVKPGDTVTIDGIVYRFGKSSSEAFNIWLELLEHGAVETDTTIDLFAADGYEGKSFPPSKIKEALEKAEQNKSPH